MTECNTLNVKWSYSQLNKLNSRIKKGGKVTFSLTQNVVGNSNDETNFPHKLLLSLRLRKTYANGSSANVNHLRWCSCENFHLNLLIKYWDWQ